MRQVVNRVLRDDHLQMWGSRQGVGLQCASAKIRIVEVGHQRETFDADLCLRGRVPSQVLLYCVTDLYSPGHEDIDPDA
jgi:hypothetical protein